MKLTSRDIHRIRIIAYWAFTLFIALEMLAGSFWDLLRIEYVRVIMTHLGYPLYVLTILGIGKLPCALALVAPRFPRLKEWAYAGAVFNYGGATASHLFAGDTKLWKGPLVFAAFTFASWALRPSSRRLSSAQEATEPTRAIEWIVSVAIVAAMIVVALLTIPKGPPPPGY